MTSSEGPVGRVPFGTRGCSAHGAGREDLSRRKLYRGLLEEGVFRRLVRIRREAGRRIYEVEVLE